jgi:hypothetical protein
VRLGAATGTAEVPSGRNSVSLSRFAPRDGNGANSSGDRNENMARSENSVDTRAPSVEPGDTAAGTAVGGMQSGTEPGGRASGDLSRYDPAFRSDFEKNYAHLGGRHQDYI